MEMELKNIIDKLKKEGVEEAEKTATDIRGAAEKEAEEILKSAEEKAASLAKDAESKVQSFQKNSEKALKQAARDVLLTLREQASAFFERIVKEKVSSELATTVIREAIVKAIGNLKKDGMLDIEVMVNEKDRDKLEKALFSSFGKEAKKHLTVTGKKTIEKGFRIGEKGKESYFDFSDEAITEALKRYLNPKLVEILDIDLGLKKKK